MNDMKSLHVIKYPTADHGYCFLEAKTVLYFIVLVQCNVERLIEE